LFSADAEAELSSLPDSRIDQPSRAETRTIMVPGVRESGTFPDQLYSDIDAIDDEASEAKFIPYFMWNNRGPAHMQVWVRRI
jgi:DUF1680 family protein